ncbi:MAG: sialate O-acetylesterase [Rubripirellula sp.]
MKNRLQRSAYLSYLSTILLATTIVENACAEDVDVYIIAGQSNAANFAERAGTGGTDVGYNLDFARDRTTFTDPNHVDQSFSSNSLDTSQAVTILSQGLAASNKQAIFGFARAGTAISNQESVNWFPGTDPANGQVDNTSMYGDFVDWTNARLGEIVAAGDTPVVKGLFWFQGERDAVQGATSVDSYETNFENLSYRFRENFGNNVPIVAAEIREGVSSNAALRASVNSALNNIAAADPRLSVVSTDSLSWVSANDVHLNTAGYQALAPVWATEMNSLQTAARTILQYDSVSNGDGTSTLRELPSLTESDFVTSADTQVSLGTNTTDFGQHNSQEQTVTFGSGTDKFFRFGGAGETLAGLLADAAVDDGEWIGASLIAEQNLTIDSFSFEMYVNSSNASSWAARDAGLFLRIGDTGSFTQFDTDYEGMIGDNGTVVFDDLFAVGAGEELQWRLAFADRTNVNTGLPATLTTRIGSIRLNAVTAVPEPGSMLMALPCLAGMMLRRRRQSINSHAQY